MKIDVENFEAEVVKGASQTITNNKCYLQIEVRYENFNEVNVLGTKNVLELTKKSKYGPKWPQILIRSSSKCQK